jgi:hypothetical protein
MQFFCNSNAKSNIEGKVGVLLHDHDGQASPAPCRVRSLHESLIGDFELLTDTLGHFQ